jgi:hypothetical protein
MVRRVQSSLDSNGGQFPAGYDVLTFPTQRTYSCSNLVAISSLVLELPKKCQVWEVVGHPVLYQTETLLSMEFHRLQTQSFTYTNNLLPTAITVAVSLF